MKKATKVENELHIKFFVPSGEFTTTLQQIKAIPGRRWDADRKIWIVPFIKNTVDYLKNIGFEIEGVPEDKPLPFVIESPRKEVDIQFLVMVLSKNYPEFKGFREYQEQCIMFMEAVNWRGFVSIFPRGGKSLVSLCGVLLHPEFIPALVICPSKAKINWQREVYKWTRYKAHIIEGTTPYPVPNAKFYIINYEILSDWVDYLPHIAYVIEDEHHRASNMTLTKIVDKKTVRVPVQCTAAVRKLIQPDMHLAMLSGTPCTSKIWQLWVGLNTLAPKEFPNEYKFKWRYCAPRHDGYGYVFDGLSNGEELHARLAKYMYRITREEGVKDLPDESHEFIYVDIDMRAYEADLADFKKWYAKHKDISDEELEEKLASFASLDYSKKRTSIIEWLNDFCESGEQIIVFAWHRTVVEDLYKEFKKKAVMMYGGMSASKCQESIDTFNAGKKQMFIANIASAKENITLAGANTVAFVEFPRTAGDLEQASQRPWLPGKMNKLQYIYFCAVDLEEARIDKLRKRAKILSKVLDGKEVEIMTDRVRGMLE